MALALGQTMSVSLAVGRPNTVHVCDPVPRERAGGDGTDNNHPRQDRVGLHTTLYLGSS